MTVSIIILLLYLLYYLYLLLYKYKKHRKCNTMYCSIEIKYYEFENEFVKYDWIEGIYKHSYFVKDYNLIKNDTILINYTIKIRGVYMVLGFFDFCKYVHKLENNKLPLLTKEQRLIENRDRFIDKLI